MSVPAPTRTTKMSVAAPSRITKVCVAAPSRISKMSVAIIVVAVVATGWMMEMVLPQDFSIHRAPFRILRQVPAMRQEHARDSFGATVYSARWPSVK